MSEYVVVSATRRVDPKANRGSTLERLDGFPDAKDIHAGTVTFLTSRTITLPGFAPSEVWDSDLAHAARFNAEAAAAKARRLGRKTFIADVDFAVEWKRLRTVARARDKARKVGRR